MASSFEFSAKAIPDEEAISVVLLRNKKTKNILYIEAGKDFVDLLLSFLTLPAGTIFRLLEEGASTSHNKIAALGNVFESVKELENRYFYVNKDLLLNQKPNVKNRLLKVEADAGPAGPSSIPRAYYRCSCYGLISMSNTIPSFSLGSDICSHCSTKATIATIIRHDGPVADDIAKATAQQGFKPGKSGFVKKNLMFIVTDELEIKRVSIISSIVLLNELKVESMTDLESFPIKVGRAEALEILHTSISSRSVLNSVFGPTTRFGKM